MNENLKKNVLNAIYLNSAFYGDSIGVAVQNGIVTLTGTISDFTKKADAEKIVKNVIGVSSVIENMIVTESVGKDNDSMLAAAISNAYKWHNEIKKYQIEVKVETGWVVLNGIVEWHEQIEAAEQIVKNFIGVKGVSNNLFIKPIFDTPIEKEAIKKALIRCGLINEATIEVTTNGSEVTLKGTTDTWFEKEQAERVAWKVAGVIKVRNDIVVKTIRDNS